MAHIYTGAPAPMEYLKLVLCRDVYHCPPDQLPDFTTCMRALAMVSAETKARNARANVRKK